MLAGTDEIQEVAAALRTAELDRVPLEILTHAAIVSALEAAGGNRTYAAKALGISVRTLQRKLKRWGEPPEAHVRTEENGDSLF
jgi:DNA-binding NtrC family response regulator